MDFITLTIEEISTSIKTGKTPPTKDSLNFENGDIEWYTPSDFNTPKILGSSQRKITKYAIENGAVVHEKDSILITCIGDIGNAGLIENDSSSNQQITSVKVNKNIVIPEFFLYWVKANKTKLQNYSNKAVIAILNNRKLKSIPISIPKDLQIQYKIVTILNKISELIQKRKRSIELLEQLHDSQFLEMFGDPVFNKKDWEVNTLKKVINKIDAGWSPVCEKESRTFNDEWAVLKQGAVSRRVFNPKENKLLPKNIEIKKSITAQKGDLLFSRKNSEEYVGSTAYVYDEYEKLLLPDTIFNLRYDREVISPIYLEYLFNDNNFRIIIQNLRSGAASSMPNISQAKLLDLEIPVPNIDLQNKFEKIVLEIYKKKKKVVDSLISLENLFHSTIQKVFNGQLNFNVSVEVDAILNKINIEEKNDLSLLTQDIAYLQNFVDRLNEQDFENQELYDKAKHTAFQLLKEKVYIEQEYSESTKSIKVVLK
ncbi:restriction endonuclease subunit S [Arcobacter sp.]|uniref:restriction endonuclease subunit S n=1 Tax=Arcobacter sp. TaxID=1872629 RepID=UPI003C7880AB